MPVRSKMPPTLISWPVARAGASRAAARSSVRFMSEPPSVRERVELPVRLDEPPPGGEAVRLEDQEENDDEPEQAHLERSEERGEVRVAVGHRAGEDPEQLREERHEHGAEDRPLHAAQAADDDQPELVDGEADGEVLRADDARLIGEERPGDADVERRHPE